MPRSKSHKRIFRLLGLVSLGGIAIYFLFPNFWKSLPIPGLGETYSKEIGESLASHRGVHVFHNGNIYFNSHGKHYSKDRYYFGQKWQCVEFVKRFYFEAHNHRMPNVWGHAKDFFDPKIPHGQTNPQRGMTQYQNSGSMRPKADDLLVFNDTKYGHVAIISSVSNSHIEVIQQNVLGYPRDTMSLEFENGKFTIGTNRKPVGWLRLESPVNP